MCLSMENKSNLNGNNQKTKMSLVLSIDAKPRLKWTCELHNRFIEAVNQLGGPNSNLYSAWISIIFLFWKIKFELYIMLFFVLQKYRLGKSLKFDENKQEVSSASENQEVESENDSGDFKGSVIKENNNPITEGLLPITEALQIQRKLHEQLEVQRHLQVKIEAQGKYLQSVLTKAQQTLSGYTSSTLGIDFTRTEISRLASMVNRGCPSSSELTQVEEEEETEGVEEGFLWSKKQVNRGIRRLRCSVESSLTSLESSETKLGNDSYERKSIELPLMEIKSQVLKGKKRSLKDVEQKFLMKRGFGVDDDEHLRLSLNSYKEDMETCPNIGLGFI